MTESVNVKEQLTQRRRDAKAAMQKSRYDELFEQERTEEADYHPSSVTSVLSCSKTFALVLDLRAFAPFCETLFTVLVMTIHIH
jgi:hypothetical protein